MSEGMGEAMSKTKRLSVEEGLEIFRNTRLVPAQGEWGLSEGEACGMGAYIIAYSLNLTLCATSTFRGIATDVFGSDYVRGYLSGFDGDKTPPPTPVNREERILEGFEDGRALWQAIENGALDQGQLRLEAVVTSA